MMIMESRSKQIFQELDLKKNDSNNEAGHEDSRSIDTSLEDSTNSVSSMSSSDLVEDESSSKSSSSSSSNGRLYELSELMAHLPIKKGLSKFYQGKSQSFTSLASVKNIEDLVKKNNFYYYKMKMKSCKSYGHGLDNSHKSSHSPKANATISKKSSIAARGSFLSSQAKTTY